MDVWRSKAMADGRRKPVEESFTDQTRQRMDCRFQTGGKCKSGHPLVVGPKPNKHVDETA